MLLFQEPAEFNWSSQTQGVVVVVEVVVETLFPCQNPPVWKISLTNVGHK